MNLIQASFSTELMRFHSTLVVGLGENVVRSLLVIYLCRLGVFVFEYSHSLRVSLDLEVIGGDLDIWWKEIK